VNNSISSYSLDNDTDIINHAFVDNEEIPSLHEKLLDWYHYKNVTRDQLDAQLHIVVSKNVDVPRSDRNIPKAVIRSIRPGDFTDIGIWNYFEFLKNKKFIFYRRFFIREIVKILGVLT